MRFKKRDLIIKEFKEGGESSDEQYADVVKQATQNSDKEATTSLSDFSSTNADNAPNIDVSATNPTTKETLKNLADTPGLQNKGFTVTMHESVTFTKGELTSWLQTL